ncbi:(Fe-S)-binding protein [Paucidesulfovibrio longus]|uniref:(Fe-S)-binding protein n=1 Tax=Paucidesulfovibrio longus TaxID=889 RepID=UPI0003B4090D|nr:(Fe-S)-binding protein [Paucidesulfovibrio longus]
MPEIPDHALPHESAAACAQTLAQGCKLCKMCLKECPLIKKWGMPGEMASRLLSGELDVEGAREAAFECTLCGLCTQVCTVSGLDPRSLFAALRREAAAEQPQRLKPYKPLLRYERTGLTGAFSFFGLPRGVRRVFFPGCSLSGTRPETVWRVLEKLRADDPATGFVMRCCAKPSLMLGRTDFFLEQSRALASRLEEAGVEELLAACPNCFNALREAKPSFAVRTVYEVLAEGDPEPGPGMERIKTAVHDPCVLRAEKGVHSAVRDLLWNHGCSVSEMRHAHHKAICCGEGGGLAVAHPELADHWLKTRLEEARGRELAVYCSGCLERLAPHAPTRHVLDILLDGPGGEPPRPSSGPAKYFNRLRLKKRAAALYRGE